jgi:AbrB family looped-hinge helix DNA binding protein
MSREVPAAETTGVSATSSVMRRFRIVSDREVAHFVYMITIFDDIWRCYGVEIRIDKAGRIVVPKPLRERLGFKPETELEAVEQPRHTSQAGRTPAFHAQG